MNAIETVTKMLGRGPNTNNGVWSAWYHVNLTRMKEIRDACNDKGFSGTQFDFAGSTIRVDN